MGASKGKMTKAALPIHRDGEFFSEAIVVVELVVLHAIFVDHAGDFDVVAAILGDVEQLAFLEPLDGLQPFGGLFHAKGRGGYRIETEPVLQLGVQIDEHVQGGQLAQVQGGVAMQHFVIEPQVVESDDQIGPLQLADELVHLFLAIDPVFAVGGVVGDSHAQAHAADLVPAADLVGRPLGFQIKIDDVFHPQCDSRRLPLPYSNGLGRGGKEIDRHSNAEGASGTATTFRLVAPIGNRLYRRLLVGEGWLTHRRLVCRLPTGDTADYQSALRRYCRDTPRRGRGGIRVLSLLAIYLEDMILGAACVTWGQFAVLQRYAKSDSALRIGDEPSLLSRMGGSEPD